VPSHYRLPPEMEEAMLICELNLPPSVIDNMPDRLIEKIMIYKGVKAVTEGGGTWEP
jgi:hypothetical protein